LRDWYHRLRKKEPPARKKRMRNMKNQKYWKLSFCGGIGVGVVVEGRSLTKGTSMRVGMGAPCIMTQQGSRGSSDSHGKKKLEKVKDLDGMRLTR
jgi:hypothetical protein